MKLLKRILVWSGIGLLALIFLCISVLGLFVGWMKWSGDRDWKRVQAELHARGEKLTLEELLPPPPPDSENFYADPMWQELTDLVKVPFHENTFGIDEPWEPRLPYKKLTINRWITPLTQSEQQQIKLLFPNEGFSEREWGARLAQIKNINRELSKTTDPDRKKQLAQLQLELLTPAEPLLSRISELSHRPSAFFPPFYRDLSLEVFPELDPLFRLSQILSYRSNAELALGNHAAAALDIQR